MAQREEQSPKSTSAGNTPQPPAQTDLAEGELETVEESIRIHEKKGDLRERPPQDKKDTA